MIKTEPTLIPVETETSLKKIEISDKDFTELSLGDPEGDFAQTWMQAHDIQPGSDIVVVRKDANGQIRERKVSTRLDDFFTSVRTPIDGSEFVDDDPLGELEYAQAIKPDEHLKRVEERVEERISAEYADMRTLNMDQLLSDDVLRQLSDEANSGQSYDSVKKLITKKEFQPVAGLRLDGFDIAFSPVLHTSKRRYVVAYAKDNDINAKVSPRLFYESQSDGGWRATPGFYNDGNISKGNFISDEYGQYVQVTKPAESVAAMLDALGRQETSRPEISSEVLKKIFTVDRPKEEEGSHFESEVRFTMVRGYGLDAFVPGEGYDKYGIEEGRNMLENMQLPDGFEPDFTTEPERKYSIEHTLLGKSGVDVFKAELNGKEIEWHVAHDKSGRIWIERLMYTNDGVTDYGTMEDIILAGALNTKPLDYVTQVEGEKPIDYEMWDKTYADLSKTIDRMPWAQRYRTGQDVG